jgi:putative hemolysin
LSLSLKIGIVLLLVLLNGFFAMSELAILSVRRSRLKHLADEGSNGARMALKMAEDPAGFLSIVQTALTLNSVFAGAFSGATMSGQLAEYLNQIAWLSPYGDTLALGITIAGVTYLNLVIGELAPKQIGLVYAEPIAIHVAWTMRIISMTAAPFVWILKVSSTVLLRILRLNKARDTMVTEQEIRDMIAEGTKGGIFKPAEQSMLEGVMRLADRTVRMIMTPRVDMVWLEVNETPEEQRTTIRTSGYSRFPVARGDLEEILGIIYAKDILNAAFDGNNVSVKSVMRPALVVPDTTSVLRLLDQFKQSGQHIAIVVDEYGSVEGLVSTTDILQTITGTLPQRGQDNAERPVQRDDGSWLIDGMAPLDEVENLVGIKNLRGDGDFHTLAGFVLEQLGRLPVAGDHFAWDDMRFEVVDMDGRRIDKVIIHMPKDDDAIEASDD